MPEPARYSRYTFDDYSGYLIHPDDAAHPFLAVRHSARVSPWADSDVHAHRLSEEHCLLLYGCLWFFVAGSVLTLRPAEILVVKPDVPHAVIRGEGSIEHFGFRAPAPSDRRSLGAVGDRPELGALPANLPPITDEDQRELRCDWGYRIPLGDARNVNCWVLGLGAARFHSPHFLFAYLDFPTPEAANAGLGTRHRLHLHRESWEYYVVLAGAKTLQIDAEAVTIRAGEMLEVCPGVRHALSSRQAPYRGFTFRVPLRDDKVEY